MIATGKWPGNDPLEIPADRAHSSGVFRRLSNYTLAEIEERLATYDKLIVVRHPLERLLSAYRNKLEAKHEKSAKYFQSRFGKKIIKVFLEEFPSGRIYRAVCRSEMYINVHTLNISAILCAYRSADVR